MTANRIGADLSDFITRNIRGPVFISGNSSGGLLAVWLAANRPALIRAALFEDPPLFASEYPRIRQTIANRAFKTSDTAATRDHPQDFLLYWVHENAQFFRNRAGPVAPFLLTQAIKAARRRNPGQQLQHFCPKSCLTALDNKSAKDCRLRRPCKRPFAMDQSPMNRR